MKIRKLQANLFSVFSGLLFFAGCATNTAALKPFTTDGCSVFPDGLPGHRQLWLKCCTEHDQRYWLGGTYVDRQKADRQLRRCVSQVGNPAIAEIMMRGVRVGGSPWWPTPFRWGYGWPYGRGYQTVTAEERAQAIRKLEGSQVGRRHSPGPH